MAKKRTKTKAKEPIKIWVKPLKNGNKAIYLRTYQAGSKGRGYTYERLKGLLLVDDKGEVTRRQRQRMKLLCAPPSSSDVSESESGV